MKRFYKEVAVAAEAAGWRVTLDGRGVKTQGGSPQVVPSEALATALAAEWAAQGEEIDPAGFLLRDMADYAIDVIPPDRGAAIAGVLRYAESDTLCYRADPDEPFHARQIEVWEPLLLAAEARWQVQFKRVSGIIHRPQPVATLSRIEKALTAYDDFALAALNTLASLSASLVIALAAAEPGADITALWNAAELEADWQVEQWGEDYEATARRERRLATFAAAARFSALSAAT
ncbi:MAG: ATP12 family chaperone protein [Novosphingobium sp.]